MDGTISEQAMRSSRAKAGHDVDGMPENYSGFKFASLTIWV